MARQPVKSKTIVEHSDIHGRGLFARTEIKKGGLVGSWPILFMDSDDAEHLDQTRLGNYVFFIEDDPDGTMSVAIAFGEVSLCNHNENPNAALLLDPETGFAELTARRAIHAGDEIFIDYEGIEVYDLPVGY